MTKETIEHLFGTAKEHHGFRYTQLIGAAKMRMKVGLTYAYFNLKKLAKLIDKGFAFSHVFQPIFHCFYSLHNLKT